MKIIIKLIFFIHLLTFSQSNQIYIDGLFDDWMNIGGYVDPNDNNVTGADFLSLSVYDDSEYLYIKFETSAEIDLSDGEYDLELLLDTDNNDETGWNPGFNDDIGVELGIMFNQRFIWYNTPEPDVQLSLYDLDIYPAPTVTSNEFEIAIALDAEYNGQALFPNKDQIRIQLIDWTSTDYVPDYPVIYSINSSSPTYSQIPIPKEKENLIRVTAYNVWNNGFNDPQRLPLLENTLQVLNSDVFAFSECSNTSEEDVKNILDDILNLNTNDGWHVIKKEYDDLILASKYPILDDWPIESNGIKAMHPCLIDLPGNIYAKDLLVINSHMSCCGSDSLRQIQADDFVNFILDAKAPGGAIDLVDGTPFVLCGDLNLVGYSQQLTTLLTGDIVNTEIFGLGGGMNWANNNLKDQICTNTEKPLAYTWRDLSPNNNIPGSYPYGRLDFIIFSDDVMCAEKSFSIDTKLMSQQTLNTYNLNSETSSASDHLAITIDFSIPMLLSIKNKEIKKKKIKSFDILGRDNQSKYLSIDIYNDGSSEKKYFPQ